MAKKHTTDDVKPETTPQVTPEYLYTIGKPYSVKVEHNQATWSRILAALESGPKTITELQKVCVYEGPNGEVVDHKRFARYMVRTKHLVIAQ